MRYLFSFCLAIAVMLMAFRSSQAFTISGFVKDQNGLPVEGVVVKEKQNTNATVTATDGSFSLRISAKRTILVISGVGYKVQEIKISEDAKPVHIVLAKIKTELNEVVVTALGIGQDKEYETYAPPSSSALYNQMQGKVAGVDVQAEVKGYGMAGGRQKKDKTAIKISGNYFRRNNDSAEFNTEEYDAITENRFLTATENPLSTFSIDVDAGSYSNVRRFLQMGQLPPSGAVRIEELINYFHYDYPQPTGNNPFSINTEISACAWNPRHQLVMIGLQGRKIATDKLPASNLVFLIDVSGSMMEPDKLPLVQRSLKLLVDQLREQDRVSLVVYAGNAGLVMPSTSGAEKTKIKDAIDRLEAGGSTAGGAGIQLAYKVAEQQFIKDGNNRVILCTDGDFNVGASSDSELERIIEKEKKTGVFLTVLGYGMGNYKDSKMEKLADKGNGNHAYIDNEREAKKVLVSEFGGTLFTIAKDVKLQIEFNPASVQAYRLIGYENRMLNKEDFNNDAKDAGELGSGHTVTAIYEIIPAGIKNEFLENVDSLKYQSRYEKTKPQAEYMMGELMTIKFRYKNPDGDKSMLLVHAVTNRQVEYKETSANFRFVSAVAQFGMLLRNSEFRQQSSFRNAYLLGKNALGADAEGYRKEFLKLVLGAEKLAKNENPAEEEDVSGIR